MRVIRVFTPQSLREHTTVRLDDQAARHLATVLRVKPGQPVTLFNGTGGEYSGTVVAGAAKQVTVEIAGHLDIERESPLQITLGIGISRGERMDWVVQKATELGAAAIAPLFTERTEVKLNPERAEKKTQHWRNIAISACEQSGRNRLPEIIAPQPLSGWISERQDGCKFVLHHHAAQPLEATAPSTMQVMLLIGPEGGLSETEVELARANGFTPLTLGPRVMRTETAPIAAISALQALWGDFR